MAIAAYVLAIWIGVTDSPWPIGRLPIEEPEYSLGFSTCPASSPGRSIPVGGPRAKAAHPFVEAVFALQFPDLDRADVARLREDLRRGQRLFGVFLGVVDRAIRHLDLIGDVELRTRGDQVLLQRPRTPSPTLNVEPGS